MTNVAVIVPRKVTVIPVDVNHIEKKEGLESLAALKDAMDKRINEMS